MTHHSKVARSKRNIIRNKWTRAKAERGIQKVRTRHEGRKRVKDLGGGRDLGKLRLAKHKLTSGMRCIEN
jgi:hypothetical protein